MTAINAVKNSSISASTPAVSNQHIVIVGGGMVGLSLALMLAKYLPDAIDISLIEKFAFSSDSKKNSSKKSALHTSASHNNISKANAEETIQQESFDARSTAISAGSAALLASIDCWDSLSDYVEAINTIHISDRGHYASTQLNAQEQAVDALGYVVENRSLGHCLLQQLQQSRVQTIAPATVERCQFTQQDVKITLVTEKPEKENSQEQSSKKNGPNKEANSQSVSADLLIIADGADSPLCRSIGIGSQKTNYQQSAIIANVALDNPHKGIAYERFTDQGPLALLPLPDCEQQHRAALVWTRNCEEANRLASASDEEFLSELQQALGHRAGKLTHVGERQMYPLALVQSSEQVRSRVVVMGNAAHFLHPVAGQGFNLSLRDCASLVDVLAVFSVDIDSMEEKSSTDDHDANVGDLAVLQRYLLCRETDQQRTIALTDTMVKTFSSTELSRSIFRQTGLLGLNAMPTAKKILAKQMMGMA
jgi:2-polyprenyl-6-methoxyphenol 4-hydroxylase